MTMRAFEILLAQIVSEPSAEVAPIVKADVLFGTVPAKVAVAVAKPFTQIVQVLPLRVNAKWLQTPTLRATDEVTLLTPHVDPFTVAYIAGFKSVPQNPSKVPPIVPAFARLPKIV